ncbi:MAG: discoidin domain-containing protein [Planctomycetes bacterium]|nr:discoidin domain-containing protein [Planctomycetota bacterium]
MGGVLSVSNVSNTGTLRAQSGTLNLDGVWSNEQGTLDAAGGTVNLGGTFTLADLGTLERNGAAVNVTGVLQNTEVFFYADAVWTNAYAHKAFDGNGLTGWSPGTSSGTITARFTTPLTFDSLVASVWAGADTTQTYTLYSSDDGVTFTQFSQSTHEVPPDYSTLAPIIFPEVTTRYLRISIEGHNATSAVLVEVTLLQGSTPVPIVRGDTIFVLDDVVTLDGGAIVGGTIDSSGAAALGISGSTALDGVILNTDATAFDQATLTVTNGLELNGTLTLEHTNASNSTEVNFSGDQVLSGTGQVISVSSAGRSDPNSDGNFLRPTDGGTLTIGSEITIHGDDLVVGDASSPLINQGSILADSNGTYRTISVLGSTVTNEGILEANSGTLDLGSTSTAGSGFLRARSTGIVTISQGLLGGTTNADQFTSDGEFRFDGQGTQGTPQLIEAMSQDLGLVPLGFVNNFRYGTLALSNGTYVQLVDQSDNSPGADPEAVYVNSLVVPIGTTLDLGGLQLYARLRQIGGTLLGGQVDQIPDSGGIPSEGTEVPGTISAAGELDEWTFFARAGQTVAIVVKTSEGVLSPQLGFVQVELLDPDDNVIASGSTSSFGETVLLNDIAIPADNVYRIHIRAAADQSASTGNYSVGWWDVTPDVSALQLNRQHVGTIENLYSIDRWTFSASAGTQVRLDFINAASSFIAFDLAGPNGWSGFSGIPGDSDLVTLLDSGTYTLTAQGTGGQAAGAYAFIVERTQVTDIDLGTSHQGMYAGEGHAELFRFELPESSPLALVLIGEAGSNSAAELYLKKGSSPTRRDFDYRFETPSSNDQSIVVPVASQGDWYALVYGDTVQAGESFTLLAQASDLLLTDYTPDHHGNLADTVLSISGAGFDSTTQVELVAADATRYPADLVERDSASRMTATFQAGDIIGPLKFAL